MKSIEVHKVSKSYNGTKALDAVDLDVREGEIFGLIGPDGAGKTSLFRIITTLILPDEGRVSVSNLDVIKDFRTIRRIIGYMPGRFSLYHDLSVRENLEFYASVFGASIEENYHLIEDIYRQLEPFRNRLAGRLSGGMKQKLALSCALIHKPRLLVLDEPTTGVDAVSRKEFWEMLMNLKKEGMTILLSTPYMDEAGECDRVGLIQDGKILQIAPPGEIERSFGRKLFALRAGNMYGLLTDLEDYKHSYSVHLFGHSLHYVDKRPDITQEQIHKELSERGHQQVQVELVRAGIEDQFMELLRKKEVGDEF